MSRSIMSVAFVAFFGIAATVWAAGPSNVVPGQFDPDHTYLVQGSWLTGIGCPTEATTSDGTTLSTFTAGGCPTGDSQDKKNEGLLLAKTGPTPNFAAAGASLKNVKGLTLTELGYDIRKPGTDQNDTRGSHCGAGAPRFNVQTSDGFWFVGCNSPAPVVAASGDGWLRLRWSPPTGFNPAVNGFTPITGTVVSIDIVFDEGQDIGPDNFGLAVLDNIDVNGTLIGRGPTNGK